MLGIVNTRKLNVRARPSCAGRKLGVISQNTVLQVTAEHAGWFEVRYQQQVGFVAADYLKIRKTVPQQTGVVAVARLNVRARPDMQAPILGTLTAGSVLTVLDAAADWLEVVFKQGSAYVWADYLTLHQPSAPQQARVIASVLNVRRQAAIRAQVIGQLSAGQSVPVLAQINEWSEIRFEQGKGYVASRYLQPLAEQVVPSESQLELPSPLAALSGERLAVTRAWQQFAPALTRLASEHELDVATVVAVLCVESGGKGFEPNNQDRLIIRFENHKFWKFWGRANADVFNAHFRFSDQQVWKGHQWRGAGDQIWQDFHGDQRKEWQVLTFARALDDNAALLSISMGAPQIMGFHYQTLGYASVQQMFEQFCHSLDAQIDGMFGFFSPAMLQSLRQLDFERFAGYYNGSGQKAFYGAAIGRHYRAFKQQVSRVTPDH